MRRKHAPGKSRAIRPARLELDARTCRTRRIQRARGRLRLAVHVAPGYFPGMDEPDNDDVTLLLQRWREGDAEALDRLLPQVYADLRRIAAGLLRAHPEHATLQTTALVNDVLLRLLGKPPSAFNDTAHLLNASARMMRHALVDRARRAATDKHGGGWSRADFEAALEMPVADGADVQSLDRALDELAEVDERMAKGVELRWFVGLEVAEIAAALGITERTAYRDWCTAREWLRTRLDAIA